MKTDQSFIHSIFQEAGRPIGGPNSNAYVMLEVHYNNPEHKTGKPRLKRHIWIFNLGWMDQKTGIYNHNQAGAQW